MSTSKTSFVVTGAVVAVAVCAVAAIMIWLGVGGYNDHRLEVQETEQTRIKGCAGIEDDSIRALCVNSGRR